LRFAKQASGWEGWRGYYRKPGNLGIRTFYIQARGRPEVFMFFVLSQLFMKKKTKVVPLKNVMQDIRAADTVQTLAKAFYPDLF
jgi:hypothetical protein